jgi:hypothetical protein
MADDVNEASEPMVRIINAYDDGEVRYWCEELGCTQDELFDAIKSAGTMADRVRTHIAAKGNGAKSLDEEAAS